jgi:hypothetical protein
VAGNGSAPALHIISSVHGANRVFLIFFQFGFTSVLDLFRFFFLQDFVSLIHQFGFSLVSVYHRIKSELPKNLSVSEKNIVRS